MIEIDSIVWLTLGSAMSQYVSAFVLFCLSSFFGLFLDERTYDDGDGDKCVSTILKIVEKRAFYVQKWDVAITMGPKAAGVVVGRWFVARVSRTVRRSRPSWWCGGSVGSRLFCPKTSTT
jgi:hypothetical protein